MLIIMLPSPSPASFAASFSYPTKIVFTTITNIRKMLDKMVGMANLKIF